MRLTHVDRKTKGEIHFIHKEAHFEQTYKEKETRGLILTIALNSGEEQTVFIDGVKHRLGAWNILPLFTGQTFKFERPEDIIAWQYNRDFYCVVDHDREVSCVGFLFFGSMGNLFIQLNEENRKKIDILQQIFIEEFNTSDNIQTDMLQMLLKRLIIITTRLAKEQYGDDSLYSNEKYELIRQYNFLVEMHYKEQHQVQFYAGELNRSAKTLSNLFTTYNYKSPLSIIHERIITEAKRLFYYTDKSTKEIAYELGFEDAAHFSRFFKNLTGQNPSDFKKAYLSSN